MLYTLQETIAACKNLETPGILEAKLDKVQVVDLKNQLDIQNYFAIILQGDNIFTKADLLEALFREFNFPSYFGFNWDALNDCLSDFSWSSASGYVIVYDSPDFLDKDALEVFTDIVLSVSKEWSDDQIIFKLLKIVKD